MWLKSLESTVWLHIGTLQHETHIQSKVAGGLSSLSRYSTTRKLPGDPTPTPTPPPLAIEAVRPKSHHHRAHFLRG
jgi:hypothetical protein